MKYTLTLGIAMAAVWYLWSGHNEPHLLIIGGLSVLLCLWIARRMGIVDEEGAPAELGIRPFTSYMPWLAKEIVVSNIEVTKTILSSDMKLKRNMIEVGANQKTALGRVILANSITLTPGTVSVQMENDRILVHALSFEGAEEDLSGEMDRRVCRLEGSKVPIHQNPNSDSEAS
ncbi:Na+/H+ antiporter subunit E [Mariniblastus fucicola]|uniref:Na(+)/H(+) antiporter subunit E n=1 Tax=Mariniblastus fucicola TaxID=980251 RepID=A0A5B9PNU1_9BACT|nr:Na+/H+ antiporter subunit E [Mariniblastus fucicola]QEG24221.1 Na(+)/H(+) antiporter subunit E [Mariniblastus fucicola]